MKGRDNREINPRFRFMVGLFSSIISSRELSNFLLDEEVEAILLNALDGQVRITPSYIYELAEEIARRRYLEICNGYKPSLKSFWHVIRKFGVAAGVFDDESYQRFITDIKCECIEQAFRINDELKPILRDYAQKMNPLKFVSFLTDGDVVAKIMNALNDGYVVDDRLLFSIAKAVTERRHVENLRRHKDDPVSDCYYYIVNYLGRKTLHVCCPVHMKNKQESESEYE